MRQTPKVKKVENRRKENQDRVEEDEVKDEVEDEVEGAKRTINQRSQQRKERKRLRTHPKEHVLSQQSKFPTMCCQRIWMRHSSRQLDM